MKRGAEEMKKVDYQVFGLAMEEDYVSYHADSPYGQELFRGEYLLDVELPGLEQVDQVLAQLTCLGYRLITHVPRPKVWVRGELELKLVYTPVSGREQVRGAGWAQEIELLVEIPDYWQGVPVEGVELLLEDLALRRVDTRRVAVSWGCFAYLMMGERGD